jgi:hypothetical protein
MGRVVSVTPRPRFSLWERTLGTHWIGGWMGLRTGLNTETRGKILCFCRDSNPGRSVCSQTLRWLSYPSSRIVMYYVDIKRPERKTISILCWDLKCTCALHGVVQGQSYCWHGTVRAQDKVLPSSLNPFEYMCVCLCAPIILFVSLQCLFCVN